MPPFFTKSTSRRRRGWSLEALSRSHDPLPPPNLANPSLSSSSHRVPAMSGRILLIDAYDSFTHNLSRLLAAATGASVHTIHIDTPFKDITPLLSHLASFSAVCIGPGPGSPEILADIGIVNDVWKFANLPVFGVCLGLQSLCLAFGGKVRRLRVVKHGLVDVVEHVGEGLFEGVGEVKAVRYHSLEAVAKKGGDVIPLAWANDENGRVLMAARHCEKPFFAVQYHPESVCTEGGGVEVVRNFWRLAQQWNKTTGRVLQDLRNDWRVPPRGMGLLEIQLDWEGRRPQKYEKSLVRTKQLDGEGLGVVRICEMMGVGGSDEFVLLDSAAFPGRYSIIGILTHGSTQRINYSVGDPHVSLSYVGGSHVDTKKVDLCGLYQGSIWRFLARFMDERRAVDGMEKSPFWGGLVGYFDYEIGVDSLDIPIKPRKEMEGAPRRPDVNLAFVERSIVMDGHTGIIYIQTLLSESSDSNWLESTAQRLRQEITAPDPSSLAAASPLHKKTLPEIHCPSGPSYIQKVHKCQTHLSSGDSYELCLTASTRVHLPKRTSPTPWALYCTLRTRNPAPYAAYIRLGATTILSSSPERFLSWTRNGTCQLRPIKGTVRKTPTTTFASASAQLNTPKERAENLMIVDLIRHDLYRFAESVKVEKLMVVEEYASVYQLVSVISGRLPEGTSGFDVLAKSLPPGSMTGAPKKRSVELLQDVEDAERGVYSGVLGYWSVCGAGDWNVVIRTAVRHDEETIIDAKGRECDVWRVGAGGAITALSTAESEFEEMETKLGMWILPLYLSLG